MDKHRLKKTYNDKTDIWPEDFLIEQFVAFQQPPFKGRRPRITAFQTPPLQTEKKTFYILLNFIHYSLNLPAFILAFIVNQLLASHLHVIL